MLEDTSKMINFAAATNHFSQIHMKNFTLILAACAILAAGNDAMAARPAKPVKHAARAAAAFNRKAAVQRATEAAAKWCSTTEKVYGWNNRWVLEETYTIEYDSKGLRTKQTCVDAEDIVTRQTFAYDANGMKTLEITEVSEDNGASFRNSSKLERTYDSRVTNFITLNKPYIWMNDDWQASGNNYTQTLTRNADGNVTMMERAVFFNGIYDPTTRITMTYGADGKATTIAESNLNYDYSSGQYYWDDDQTYTDIVWDRTNGQITSNEDLMSGANRISSAKIVDGDDEMNVTVTYDENGGYSGTMTGTDGDDTFTSNVFYSVLDDNGSFKVITDTYYFSNGEPYYSESYTETYKYDAYGLIIQESVEFSDGTYSEFESIVEGTIEYDPVNGYPLTYTLQSYDPDEGKMVNGIRMEFSDYVDVVGIGDITADSADAPVEYFNLQGIRVANPTPGQVYIRRQGDSATKVLVK